MFRNQYDNDVTVWSPQGRIHQLEYAMEAVKQGSATVGLKSRTHAVIVALKRAQSDLTAHQKKLVRIAPHIVIGISGLTADGRSLGSFMRTECLHSDYVFSRPLPVPRLVQAVGNKTQKPTQRYGRRPFGVGILIAGYDEKGPHIFQTCPSANFYNCKAMAIGSRSQSARTYLERHCSKFLDCSPEELISHGLRALRETLPSEQELSTSNCSVSIVGKDQNVEIFEDEAVGPFLKNIEEAKQSAAAEPMQDTPEVGQGELSGMVPPVSAQPPQDDDQAMET